MDVVGEEPDLTEQMAARESVCRLRKVLGACLTAQEYLVLQMRYGLDGRKPLRQREVAEVTGISRSYVSRIEKRALEKLRQALK